MEKIVSQRVQIIGPSGCVSEEETLAGQEWLTSRGYFIESTAAIRERSLGFYNGTHEERLNEIQSAFINKNADIIWLARGGFGLLSLLPSLKISPVHKPLVVGFSDGTALLSFVWTQHQLPSIYGPNIKNLPDLSAQAETALLALLTRSAAQIRYPSLSILHKCTTENVIEDTLIPANLCVLTRLLGTDFFPVVQPSILMLEDVNEHPYRLAEMLSQLAMNKYLGNIKAIIMGYFTQCGDEELLKNIFIDFARRYKINLFSGMKTGHEKDNWALPFGTRCRITMNENSAQLQLIEELNAAHQYS